MLKLATQEDLPVLVDMAEKFAKSTEYAEYLPTDHLQDVIRYFLGGQDRIIIMHGNDGMLAGMLAPLMFSKTMIANEVAWWVEPDKRKSKIGAELLEAFEYWAKMIGAKFVQMSSLDESVGSLYEKKGYKLYERAYMKNI